MKSVEITDQLVEAMASHKFEFLRCNYPNGDMVGHTGVLRAVITAMEAVDTALGPRDRGCRQVRLHRCSSPPTTATPTR